MNGIPNEEDLTKRQLRIIKYLQKKKHITNSGCQKLLRVSKSTATRELNNLMEMGIIQKEGKVGQGTTYRLMVKKRK